MLRVLFVSHSLPPRRRALANVGGMQRVAVELVDALDRHPKVTLQQTILRASSRWMYLGTPAFLLWALWRVARAAQKGTVDVVLYSSMVTASMQAVLGRLLRYTGVKTAAIAHGRDVTQPFAPYQWLVCRALRALDLVLPVSRAVADACRGRGAPEACLQVVPDGVDPERFAQTPPCTRPSGRARRSTERHEWAEGVFTLLSVGRHVPRKGFAWFARHVLARLPNGACWVLAGEGRETPAIRAAIQELGLERRVRLVGKVPEDDLGRLYRSADLMVMPNLVLPSDMEGFGVVILEAGLCGLPVLCADIEGMRDVVTEGRNGFLAPSGDPEAWVARITELMTEPHGLEDVSRIARRHTIDHFAWPAVAERYVGALAALL